MLMPFAAVMVPEFEILPLKVWTALSAMPVLALMVPKFEILPPLKFATVTLPVPPTRMPAPFVAVI
jgi:hypothetical protein